MKAKSVYKIIVLMLLFIHGGVVHAQSRADYDKLMQWGRHAFYDGQLKSAFYYFSKAQLEDPTQEEPAVFINVIKVMVKDNPAEVIKDNSYVSDYKPRKPMFSRAQSVNLALDQFEKSISKRRSHSSPQISSTALTDPTIQKVSPKKTMKFLKEPPIKPSDEIVYLNQELQNSQPNTKLTIEHDSYITLEGNDIDRFLIITPGFIEIKRINRDQIQLIAKQRGSTLIHVWDDTTRWTFKAEVVLPFKLTQTKLIEQSKLDNADPFRFTYSVDFSQFYLGQSFSELERQNLNIVQKLLLEGETPYGDAYGWAVYNKFDLSTELTSYGIGLTDGRIGNFKDFNIRGFDTYKEFSQLSLPGQYYRGITFESKAFDGFIDYAYIHGRDRATSIVLTPGVVQERDSYIQGFKVTLNADQSSNVSFNYARGYGDARRATLKDKVYTLEAQHEYKDWLFESEFGYDEDTTGLIASSAKEGENYNAFMSFRDINKDFTTITSLPSNRGEIGASFGLDYNLPIADVSSYLDIYKDRFLPNPEHEDLLNYDFSSTVDIPLNHNDRVQSSIYYIYTPGELSPRRNLRSNTTYYKRLKLTEEKELSFFLGSTYQRSRFNLTPTSEYDRISFNSGVSFPLSKRLNYFANFEYSVVDEINTNDKLYPRVFNTGLNYFNNITDAISVNASLSYRNEEESEGVNSFLAGEDNITTSLGLTYRPHEDFEFFIDGRSRNVWAESSTRGSFNEVDIRGGVRTSWDLPLVWNPQGIVRGVVFKDINANKKQDKNEPGLSNVVIDIADKSVTTDEQGEYKVLVKGKRALVSIDINSIPHGFMFTTSTLERIQIIPHKIHEVNFGLNSQSGIFGVVFVDSNENGKPDSGEKFISRVKVALNKNESVFSDFEGTYFFKNIVPGSHELMIDVNSIPIEYLPQVPLKKSIELSEGATYVYHVPLKSNKVKD